MRLLPRCHLADIASTPRTWQTALALMHAKKVPNFAHTNSVNVFAHSRSRKMGMAFSRQPRATSRIDPLLHTDIDCPTPSALPRPSFPRPNSSLISRMQLFVPAARPRLSSCLSEVGTSWYHGSSSVQLRLNAMTRCWTTIPDEHSGLILGNSSLALVGCQADICSE